MPLSPELMYCAARIIGNFGKSRAAVGTGFCVTVPSEVHDSRLYGYILSAHHVIHGRGDIEVEVPNPLDGGIPYPAIKVIGWRQPLPDVDLMLAPFPPIDGGVSPALEVGIHLHHGLDNRALLGAQLHYVGLLAPLDRPMARSGTIGAINQIGIRHDGGYMYPCHLVDCRSYGGFSGSPCFVEFPFPTLTPKPPPDPISPPNEPVGRLRYVHLLCGMFTEHFDDEDPIRAVSRLGIGFMLPADLLYEGLMTPEARDERQSWDSFDTWPPPDSQPVASAPI
jgi:hypothetical protein